MLEYEKLGGKQSKQICKFDKNNYTNYSSNLNFNLCKFLQQYFIPHFSYLFEYVL
jgi:hypothetical protein